MEDTGDLLVVLSCSNKKLEDKRHSTSFDVCSDIAIPLHSF
jgi:hypothetical protein